MKYTCSKCLYPIFDTIGAKNIAVFNSAVNPGEKPQIERLKTFCRKCYVAHVKYFSLTSNS